MGDFKRTPRRLPFIITIIIALALWPAVVIIASSAIEFALAHFHFPRV